VLYFVEMPRIFSRTLQFEMSSRMRRQARQTRDLRKKLRGSNARVDELVKSRAVFLLALKAKTAKIVRNITERDRSVLDGIMRGSEKDRRIVAKDAEIAAKDARIRELEQLCSQQVEDLRDTATARNRSDMFHRGAVAQTVDLRTRIRDITLRCEQAMDDTLGDGANGSAQVKLETLLAAIQGIHVACSST
jgi:hypothetical protein